VNGQAKTELPPRLAAELDEAVLRRVAAVRRENAEALNDPIAMARFLCGVSSPALARKRLSGHPLFGALTHVPFEVVRERLG
jgi:ATP-dependent DNA helicase RecQ